VASAGEQVAVELGDRGGSPGLDRQVTDARGDIEPDTGPVVEQGALLDLLGVAVDPVIEVRADGDVAAVDVLPAPGVRLAT
jgi:hypothetical protein